MFFRFQRRRVLNRDSASETQDSEIDVNGLYSTHEKGKSSQIRHEKRNEAKETVKEELLNFKERNKELSWQEWRIL